MLKSILLSSVLALSINAQATGTSATGYSLAQASFGADGATLSPTPNRDSVIHAKQIYMALNVKAKANGIKSVGINSGKDFLGFSCEQPSSGLHTETAGCSFESLILTGEAQHGKDGEVTIRGIVAEKLFNSLNVAAEVRAGGSSKTVANLSCHMGLKARMKKTYRCSLKEVMAFSMTADRLIQDGALTQKDLDQLVKKLKLSAK